MSRERRILMLDNTDRGQRLAMYWYQELECDVIYWNNGEWFSLGKDGKSRIKADRIIASACLVHENDSVIYEGPNRCIIDSCTIKVGFSKGGGRGERKLPASWPRIIPSIAGPDSVNEVVWRQFRDWLFSQSRDVDALPTLLTDREPHHLRALYILCEGFLAARRLERGIPGFAARAVLTREWWTVPLLAVAGKTLVERVAEDWIESVPADVDRLCMWISDDAELVAQEFQDVVSRARDSLYDRLN